MDSPQAANDKLAMKMIRLEVNRILLRWDPLGVRDLPGGEREYEPYVGPLAVMAKKGEDYMAIARHLDELTTGTWKLPRAKDKCVDVARRIYNAGALFRGEKPMAR